MLKILINPPYCLSMKLFQTCHFSPDQCIEAICYWVVCLTKYPPLRDRPIVCTGLQIENVFGFGMVGGL